MQTLILNSKLPNKSNSYSDLKILKPLNNENGLAIAITTFCTLSLQIYPLQYNSNTVTPINMIKDIIVFFVILDIKHINVLTTTRAIQFSPCIAKYACSNVKLYGEYWNSSNAYMGI